VKKIEKIMYPNM